MALVACPCSDSVVGWDVCAFEVGEHVVDEVCAYGYCYCVYELFAGEPVCFGCERVGYALLVLGWAACAGVEADDGCWCDCECCLCLLVEVGDGYGVVFEYAAVVGGGCCGEDPCSVVVCSLAYGAVV